MHTAWHRLLCSLGSINDANRSGVFNVWFPKVRFEMSARTTGVLLCTGWYFRKDASKAVANDWRC